VRSCGFLVRGVSCDGDKGRAFRVRLPAAHGRGQTAEKRTIQKKAQTKASFETDKTHVCNPPPPSSRRWIIPGTPTGPITKENVEECVQISTCRRVKLAPGILSSCGKRSKVKQGEARYDTAYLGTQRLAKLNIFLIFILLKRLERSLHQLPAVSFG